MKDIELKIWDYIDGICSEGEKKVIENLIDTDRDYKKTYEELISLNNDINLIGIDAPSMVFTNKVMAQIDLQVKPLSAKAKINKSIIYSIAAFFALMIASCIMVAVAEIDWSNHGSTVEMSNFNTNHLFKLGSINMNFVYVFLMLYVMVVLLFIDKYLRKNLNSKYV